MRAVQLPAPAPIAESPLRLVELPDPEPGAGEILIRLSACAVCRTDLQIAQGDVAAPHLPVTLGHQAVGTIEKLGEGSSGWKPGDRVGAYWLFETDNTCRFCRSGRENLCENAAFTGLDRNGGFADAMVARADTVVALPEGFADIDAAPLLCGGVIGYRALRVSGIQPGGRLGLFGFGASALLCIQVARHWGCEVHVRARSPHELERAEALGAASVGGYDDPTPPLDAAITTAPVGEIVVAALRSLDRGGIVAINAIHLDRIPEFPYERLWWERQLRSVANVTRADAREFMQLASEIPLRTHADLFALEAANDALRLLDAGRIEGAAVLTMNTTNGAI